MGMGDETAAQVSQENSQPSPPVKLRKPPPTCPAKLVLFCCNLFIGLGSSQLIPELMDTDTYSTWKHVVKAITMCCVSYIMFHVGLEFEIDKNNLSKYITEYFVAMTAAGFPWIFCALYLMFALGPGHNLPWQEALIAARFAAPTSAGILFTMLEAAGMKETWIFKKARVLAIFDDLDTLLLMVPLKAMYVGLKWELSIDLIFVTGLCFIMYRYLHRVDIPTTWPFICLYSVCVAGFCELLHFLTHSDLADPRDLVDTVHLEVLLPAFTVGCIVKHGHEEDSDPKHRGLAGMVSAGTVKTCISAVFMVLVGFSMPALFTDKHELGGHRRLASSSSSSDDHGSKAEPIGAGMMVVHVLMCTILMNVGKMFPAFCYKKETNKPTRLALAIAMMPRGEVCAGIIVNAIALGITGPAITIAVFCLALNMMMVSGFIFVVKVLTGFSNSRLSRSFNFTKEQESPSPASPGPAPAEVESASTAVAVVVADEDGTNKEEVAEVPAVCPSHEDAETQTGFSL
eukprot:TRINITY_DN31868_c0_g1_i1.p1 TRINITY_DN31868_c0_g1~~TRINITY_DN31868_c0_g1_i1.p1  ORF type:complete len:526 (-),score=88.14 TRINITY_DN31868_c0_g1_i1:179-1720(-)